MSIQMNSGFKSAPLTNAQKALISKIENAECQKVVQELLLNDINASEKASRIVILATASAVFEQKTNDLETIFKLCKHVRSFKNAFMASTLVIFGAKGVKGVTDKSSQNTYYVDPSNFADLSDLKEMIEAMNQAELEARFSQFFGSAEKKDDGIRIKPFVLNAQGTLTKYSNAYKVRFLAKAKDESTKDFDETVKSFKEFFKKADLSKAELETVLNEVLKSAKLKVASI